jgi:hypothetical protein
MNEEGVIVRTHHAATRVPVWIAAIALTLGLATEAHAQGPIRTLLGEVFISPSIGYDFGGDAGCPNVTGCTTKRLNEGLALGVMGKLLGFDEEFGYVKHFYGSAPGLSSNVETLMTNIMVIPAIGLLHPYAAGGLGLIRSHSNFTTPETIFGSNNDDFGWDAGGGVILLIGHFGVTGDFRYYHSFQNLALVGFNVTNQKLGFGRVGGGLVFKF